MSHIEGLNTRYQIVLTSKTEPEFYMNTYYYYDFIFKNSVLNEIFSNAEKEYTQKFGTIWRDYDHSSEDDISRRSEQVGKMERFDLFSNGCSLYVRVYVPIDDYKNTDDPDDKQDPIAVALVKGIKYAQRVCANPNRMSKKEIAQSYNQWFTDRRSTYEKEFSRFHLLLLEALESNKLTPKQIVHASPLFDQEKSILTVGGKDVRITLKNDRTNSHYVLEYLFHNDLSEQSFYTEIIEKQFDKTTKWMTIYRACNDIQEKVRKQAGIEDFLEITTGVTGWVRIKSRYR